MARTEKRLTLENFEAMSEELELEQEMNQTEVSLAVWAELERRANLEDKAFKGERIFYASTETQVGRILVASSSEGLCRLALPTEGDSIFWSWLRRRFAKSRVREDSSKNGRILDELQAYFAGELHEFDLPVDVRATPFQADVLHEIARIPFGKLATYSEIAKNIGNPIARQAVGAATGSNPIPIVIPCHRVVGADGRMVGYGGGIPLKEWLLHLEGHNIEDHKLIEKRLFD